MDDALIPTIEENAGTLANYTVEIETFARFELPSILILIRSGTPVLPLFHAKVCCSASGG